MENVGGVRVVVGGEAGKHGVPQQLKEVGVDSGERILGQYWMIEQGEYNMFRCTVNLTCKCFV